MAIKYTEEQLNTIDKSLLVQMFLNQQEQLETLTTEVRSLNEKMQLMMEQLVLSNRKLSLIHEYQTKRKPCAATGMIAVWHSFLYFEKIYFFYLIGFFSCTIGDLGSGNCYLPYVLESL